VLGIEDQVVRMRTIAGKTVAYSVVGEGPPVVVGGWWCSHLTLNWQDPDFRAYVSRLAERNAIIRYDRPGTGASGLKGDVPQTLDDEVGVMAGVVDALVTTGSPWSAPPPARRSPPRCGRPAPPSHPPGAVRVLRTGRGHRPRTGPGSDRRRHRQSLGLGRPHARRHFRARCVKPGSRGVARFQRQSATPEQAARSLAAIYELDVTEPLSRMRVPTTVIHRRDDRRHSLRARSRRRPTNQGINVCGTQWRQPLPLAG
jgi:pimeloyl-ACP methyl ester carboxylesterase